MTNYKGTVRERIAALRSEMARLGLDALVVPRHDAHQGEYVASCDARLEWATGFTGSAGMAAVLADRVALFVDGRYTVQAAGQCPEGFFEHHHFFDDPIDLWLAKTLKPGQRLGLDAMLTPPAWFERFRKATDEAGAEIAALADNPVDAVWDDRPPPPRGRISAFPMQYAGRSRDDKMAGIAQALTSAGADILVETQPDNIAWLLNVRGADVEFNPVPQSFLILDNAQKATWFVDAEKLDSDLSDGLGGVVDIRAPRDFLPVLGERLAEGQRLLADPDFSPAAAGLAAEAAGAGIVAARSPVTMAKAVKNTVELQGFRDCHLEDGVAWTEFGAWLAQEVPARAAAENPVTEREAEQLIRTFRATRAGFVYDSFNPISAAAGNAAMCHYATTAASNAPILPGAPYLLDSGGQYLSGTTDATRSYGFGTLPKGYRRAYTAVLRAFVALATLRFPKGTQGHHIDAVCRRPLWDLGLDYDHGTGHGIGHFLSVHEHPQRIGKAVNAVDLRPGMVMSIEPGHYVAGLYGIRIENLFEIVEAEDGFMEFRNLTLTPIQTDTLDIPALGETERGWLNRFHADVRRKLSALVSDAAKPWLTASTEPI